MAQTSTAAVPTGPIQDVKAHTSSTKLEDQAALAALYVTKYDNNHGSSKKNGQEFLDKDNKLSSAGKSPVAKFGTCGFELNCLLLQARQLLSNMPIPRTFRVTPPPG